MQVTSWNTSRIRRLLISRGESDSRVCRPWSYDVIITLPRPPHSLLAPSSSPSFPCWSRGGCSTRRGGRWGLSGSRSPPTRYLRSMTSLRTSTPARKAPLRLSWQPSALAQRPRVIFSIPQPTFWTAFCRLPWCL